MTKLRLTDAHCLMQTEFKHLSYLFVKFKFILWLLNVHQEIELKFNITAMP